MRQSQCPNESLKATFPERYVSMAKTGKNQETVYMDSQDNSNHEYTAEV